MVFFVFQGIAIETLFPFMSALAKTLNEDIRRSALSPLRVQHRIPILSGHTSSIFLRTTDGQILTHHERMPAVAVAISMQQRSVRGCCRCDNGIRAVSLVHVIGFFAETLSKIETASLMGLYG
ncbi:hypothetical protein CISG_05571 [Coccidioides immitis RMSCC 3703]|uniref:Uncharacterized protein n=2 Tax=Coccidioides immitis TaxID=5501 RepID=A0A0J8QXV7_COCIT|nr:hypothetical protein CIRG_02794 [Coccidioides immitis RMSCC 2394]KMU76203.1 hypothetical protein CISG_05571 [Coccidioides immitis RMSCC 3703]